MRLQISMSEVDLPFQQGELVTGGKRARPSLVEVFEATTGLF